ncbi:branched-chain amino acid ABC transporter permease [Desulfosoma caldarium]|uniref:Amino acid/amide ABC transporter membrane protein 2 (HAAT family) n=1 Tax=Desulfosoma caldarium TaxID=610254 RepID=A0A3N1UWZ2_9BACT|nr:branched-chain amino acid ABC transporter permease [Desulfosoma caldarium]ROQ93210.1 amino acid/amide ABC transporter membrane protein 2 (HAAT family) [Desulfosoma caldarium]
MRRFLGFWLYVIFSLVLLWICQARWLTPYVQLVVMFIGINIILSSSLNLINGYMGEFSCGHAGFMAVGAYVASILNVWLFTSHKVFGPALLSPSAAVYLFPVTLFAGGVAAALAGLLVAFPSFRTRGDYLAIITLAVNYIVKSSVENIQAIGGARGFMGMRKVIEGMEAVWNIPWVMLWILVCTGLTVWVLHRFVSSSYGKGIVAIRDDEIAAEIMGVNTRRMKLMAFMLSSGLAGIAGGLFAHILGYINPGTFTIMKSTEVMVMVYLGGMGSLSGSVLSAVAFTLILELLRPLQVIKWVVIPLLLILLMLLRPEGFLGNRELTDVFPRLRRWFAAGKEA